MEHKIIELNRGEVNGYIKDSEKLVIVEFYSNTCAPCKAVEPTYQKLSIELDKWAVFTKINIQTNRMTAQKYGVMGTPTFKFFCAGRPIGEIVGDINATLLRNSIKDMVKHKNVCVTKSTPINYDMDGYM